MIMQIFPQNPLLSVLGQSVLGQLYHLFLESDHKKTQKIGLEKKKVLFVDVDYKMIKVEKGAKNGEQK